MSRKISVMVTFVCLATVLVMFLPGRLPHLSSLAQAPERQQKPVKPPGEDEPVAVTERKPSEGFPLEERLGPSQFGNLRSQIRTTAKNCVYRPLHEPNCNRGRSGHFRY